MRRATEEQGMTRSPKAGDSHLGVAPALLEVLGL
jgi:hypothetical protein